MLCTYKFGWIFRKSQDYPDNIMLITVRALNYLDAIKKLNRIEEDLLQGGLKAVMCDKKGYKEYVFELISVIEIGDS